MFELISALGSLSGENGTKKCYDPNPDTPDINNYKNAVYWIREHLNSDPKYLKDDTRFWVQVPAI